MGYVPEQTGTDGRGRPVYSEVWKKYKRRRRKGSGKGSNQNSGANLGSGTSTVFPFMKSLAIKKNRQG